MGKSSGGTGRGGGDGRGAAIRWSGGALTDAEYGRLVKNANALRPVNISYWTNNQYNRWKREALAAGADMRKLRTQLGRRGITLTGPRAIFGE